MPLYEYRCESCGHRFETLQQVGAGAADVSCPRCAAGRVARELSTFAARAATGRDRSPAPEPTCGRGGCGAGFCAN